MDLALRPIDKGFRENNIFVVTLVFSGATLNVNVGKN